MARTLLLQGPVGPFFRGLANELRRRGDSVTQILFNGGDAWFSAADSTVDFTGDASAWPAFLTDLLKAHRIDRVFLFGDCRPLHVAALPICAAHGVTAYVVEEGYLRPAFVTIEEGGVNANSTLPRDPAWYLARANDAAPPPQHTYRAVFLRRIWICCTYYVAMALGRRRFPAYVHHRRSSIIPEGLAWVRSGWRSLHYRWSERKTLDELRGRRFYLVPLQVHNDSQITCHSDVLSVGCFLRTVVASFAANAPADSELVIKHHPMDRGYRDYTQLIARLTERHGLAGRVRYIHDVSLPRLLRRAQGVVVLNSTVGISALIHGVPVLALGNAIYRMPGLASDQPIDSFWTAPAPVDRRLVIAFRSVLLRRTQLNASTCSATSSWDLLDRLPGFNGRRWSELAPAITDTEPTAGGPLAMRVAGIAVLLTLASLGSLAAAVL